MHLWEIDHPYYCNDGNYFASGNDQPTCHYKTFGEFIEAEGDSDFDLNLIFRWDWQEGEDYGLPTVKEDQDVYYRNGRLCIYWMGQRKGLYRWTTIEVCRADESDIIKFLKPRWNHMRKLWEGISS